MFGNSFSSLETLGMNKRTNVQCNQFVIISDQPSSLAPNPTSIARFGDWPSCNIVILLMIFFALYFLQKCPLFALYFFTKCPLFCPLFLCLCPLWIIGQYALGQCVEKPRVSQGEWSPWGSHKAQTRWAAGPEGFWLWDFLRDSIRRDTPKACPHILILISSRTRKEGFL